MIIWLNVKHCLSSSRKRIASLPNAVCSDLFYIILFSSYFFFGISRWSRRLWLLRKRYIWKICLHDLIIISFAFNLFCVWTYQNQNAINNVCQCNTLYLFKHTYHVKSSTFNRNFCFHRIDVINIRRKYFVQYVNWIKSKGISSSHAEFIFWFTYTDKIVFSVELPWLCHRMLQLYSLDLTKTDLF